MARPASAKHATRRGVRKSGGLSVDFASVAELIRLMDEHQLLEVEIESGGSRIRLVRDHAGLAGGSSGKAAAAAEPPPAGPTVVAPASGRPIISPMIGTFYRSPSPDTAPFVEVGAIVEKGDTLCIIEAMKMMNEIEAEFRGRVTRVVADNGQTVEYGEELFLVEPL